MPDVKRTRIQMANYGKIDEREEEKERAVGRPRRPKFPRTTAMADAVANILTQVCLVYVPHVM